MLYQLSYVTPSKEGAKVKRFFEKGKYFLNFARFKHIPIIFILVSAMNTPHPHKATASSQSAKTSAKAGRTSAPLLLANPAERQQILAETARLL
ncbi:MAG: hypothetical protein K2L79_05020, partial [Bacteroidales bacterium]|nr:hypothetical protein [Bacteroidales bacterium]